MTDLNKTVTDLLGKVGDTGDRKLNRMIGEILGLINFLELSEEEQDRIMAAELAARRARTRAKNERFARALGYSTDIQAARISKLELDGMKVVKLWQNRSTGKIAVMMQKDGVWDQQTGRIRAKLAMVYKDGGWTESFGKITIENDRI